MQTWFAIVTFFIVHVVHASEIITTNDFDAIETVCRTLNKNSLVLFDVDATLIVPNDAILRPQGKELFENLVATYTDRDLFREIRMKAAHSVVDGRSVDFIHNLQQQEVPVIALTAAPAIVRGSKCPGTWRVDELKRFGFEFQNAFPQNNCILLPKTEQYEHFPMFKLGVLYSSFHPKGDVLVAFLQHLNLIPKVVIFVDDELKHVQSVVSCLDRAGIQCIGVHYTAASEMPCELNPELGSLQVDHFVKTGVWLSDTEAQDFFSLYRTKK